MKRQVLTCVAAVLLLSSPAFAESSTGTAVSETVKDVATKTVASEKEAAKTAIKEEKETKLVKPAHEKAAAMKAEIKAPAEAAAKKAEDVKATGTALKNAVSGKEIAPVAETK